MGRKYSSFNQEEIRILKENPNTASVTKSRLSVTLDAKKAILELHQAGWTSRRIVEELGYEEKKMFQCTDHQADLNAYPYHIRDVHISDPFILPDEKSGRYYIYAQFVDSRRFPEVPAGPGHFYVLENPDLIHWSEPRVCFEKE